MVSAFSTTCGAGWPPELFQELFEIAFVFVRLESRCLLHRKRESGHHLNGCETSHSPIALLAESGPS
jgi:hypothetical protein